MRLQVNVNLTDEQAKFLAKTCKKSGNSQAAEIRACVQYRIDAENKK